MEIKISNNYPFYTWNDIKDNSFKTLILGNGASISINSCFSYPSLFSESNITEKLKLIFNHFNTNDFEHVLNLLLHTNAINKILEINDNITMEGYQQIRNELICAVRKNHSTYENVSLYLDTIFKFMKNFKTIVSLNYDLIVYWAMMKGNDELKGYWFKDCFINGKFAEDIERYREPLDTTGTSLVFYPHGNLIFSTDSNGNEQKINKVNDCGKLLDTIFKKWSAELKIPLFVSEGNSEQKLNAIRRSRYLSEVYTQILDDLGDSIVAYGWSFNDNDNHILKQILRNKNLKKFAISIYDNPPNDESREDMISVIDRKIKKYSKNKVLETFYFNARSPGCWINP